MSRYTKIRVTLDLEIDNAGLSNQEVVKKINRAIRNTMGEGHFTGGTDATIEDWKLDTSIIDADNSKNKSSKN